MYNAIRRYIKRNFGQDREYIRVIDDMFGVIPYNVELYKLALIHKSASFVVKGSKPINNERLEYLGDAIIEAVTSDYLYIEYPTENEGFLTQLRSKIVSRQSLNQLAKSIGLDKQVIFNSTGNFTQKHIYGDAFEAMIGALYLDQGYEVVNRLLINNIYLRYLDIDEILHSECDYKSRLIEWAQKERHTIEFRTSNDKSYSMAHPQFYSTVYIGGVEVGHGTGESKKEAEQKAAYSVSQGAVTDQNSDELLDKIDALEVEHTTNNVPTEEQPQE